MELKKKVLDALNKQINDEFNAAQIYLSMSAYFENIDLKGFASWMRKQVVEENEHGMKIFDYINDRQGKVSLGAINKPKSEWKTPLNAAQEALAHERRVTGLIHSLMNLAQKENDHATQVFLHWFVSEQVEEEDQATQLVEKLKLIGDSRSGLLMLDAELGKRE